MTGRHAAPWRAPDAPGLKTYRGEWMIETYLAADERKRLGLPRPAHASGWVASDGALKAAFSRSIPSVQAAMKAAGELEAAQRRVLALFEGDREKAALDAPPCPPELCGVDGCVFTPHSDLFHSWGKEYRPDPID